MLCYVIQVDSNQFKFDKSLILSMENWKNTLVTSKLASILVNLYDLDFIIIVILENDCFCLNENDFLHLTFSPSSET